MQKITVSIRNFENTYAVKPSGTGTWFFFSNNESFKHTGPYSEAKKAAIAWAKEKGYQEIEVGT